MDKADWIPVSERLPKPYERVLVFDESIPAFKSGDTIRSNNYLAIGYYQPQSLSAHFGLGDWFVPDGTTPTHWMPLPGYPD